MIRPGFYIYPCLEDWEMWKVRSIQVTVNSSSKCMLKSKHWIIPGKEKLYGKYWKENNCTRKFQA